MRNAIRIQQIVSDRESTAGAQSARIARVADGDRAGASRVVCHDQVRRLPRIVTTRSWPRAVKKSSNLLRKNGLGTVGAVRRQSVRKLPRVRPAGLPGSVTGARRAPASPIGILHPLEMKMANYTEIKVIVNLTDESVVVKNHEFGTEQSVTALTAEAGSTLVVPWAGSEAAYKSGRKLSVSTKKEGAEPVGRAWFWEDSSMIYTNTADAWNDKVTPVIAGSYWTMLAVAYKDNTKSSYKVTLQQIR